MDSRIEANRRKITDLLMGGPHPGHALVMNPRDTPRPWDDDDLASGRRPVSDWVPWAVENYERWLRESEEIGDDAVPHLRTNTGTHIFAQAFGCEVEYFKDSNPAARPRVFSAEEADALPEVTPDAPPLQRVIEYAKLLRERCGPEAPIAVPDQQSPFDIANIIWDKGSLMMAMMDEPGAVMRLTEKCERLLTGFVERFRDELGEVTLWHCTHSWAPKEAGVGVSEDEVGIISLEMFRELSLPSLRRLSERFGGMLMHCCAQADHQYPGFKDVPNLRGLNRVFAGSSPGPAIEAFTPGTVLIQAWSDLDYLNNMLDLAKPETRFIFDVHNDNLDDAKRRFELLKPRCEAPAAVA